MSVPVSSIMSNSSSCATRKPQLALLRFGALEGNVLRLLWVLEEATLADLHRSLALPELSVAALRRALEKLHLKRVIYLRTVGRTCYYRAALDRNAFINLLREQLADFFDADGLTVLPAHARQREMF